MTDSRPWIVVTGPTGQQGGATARSLVEHHSERFRVRCVCRDPSNELATILRKDLTQIESLKARKGTFELVQGDLLDKSSLLRAFDGAWGVFLVTTWATTPWKLMRDRMEPPTMDGVQIERKQGQNTIEAAIEKQITYFIYTSVGGLQDDYCGIAYWNSKLDVERMLKAKAPPAGMKWAILSPCMFFDNWNTSQLIQGSDQEIRGTYPGKTRMRFTAVKDIGWFGAYMFANMDKTAGKKLELATDIMSYDEAADRFAKVLGRPMPYRRLKPEEIPKADDPPPAEGSGKNLIFKVDIEEIRKIHPGYVTLEEFLRTDWNGKDAVRARL